MGNKVILLVEDNPDDEALTLRALHKHNVTNQVVITRDGAEATERVGLPTQERPSRAMP